MPIGKARIDDLGGPVVSNRCIDEVSLRSISDETNLESNFAQLVLVWVFRDFCCTNTHSTRNYIV